MIFLWILIWWVTWLIVRARAMFVYLFKNSQCILSYDSSSLGTENKNELWFHLVREYVQKLVSDFLSFSVNTEYIENIHDLYIKRVGTYRYCIKSWRVIFQRLPILYKNCSSRGCLYETPKLEKQACEDCFQFQCKKISNDQELIQSDPISCPQNQNGNN